MSKTSHEKRDSNTGRYVHSTLCDCCGKPCGTEPLCDDEVCGDTDGPGFFICERKRCAAKRDPMTIEQRRELYTAQRAANEAKQS